MTRKNINTTIDEDLYKEIRILALQKGVSANELFKAFPSLKKSKTQCVVIADDLTGANATGVLLKKMDYKAFTVMNSERIELSSISDCDCVLYPTDSRGVDPEIAYNRVQNVCNLLKNDEVRVYSKRIDSTLRGNLGSETDAMLDCLGEDYRRVRKLDGRVRLSDCGPQNYRGAGGD